MPAPTNKQILSASDHRIINQRLPDVLQFLVLRTAGLTVAQAARMAGLPASTARRLGQRLLDHGLPGLQAAATARREKHPPAKVSDVMLSRALNYLLLRARGFPCPDAARFVSTSPSVIHDLGCSLLARGVRGLDPHDRWQRECERWEITPSIVDQVEQLAGEKSRVWQAWREFARSPKCPALLSLFIRRQRKPPQFLLRAVRLRAIKLCARRGTSGRIYLRAGHRTVTLEKPRHAKAHRKH